MLRLAARASLVLALSATACTSASTPADAPSADAVAITTMPSFDAARMQADIAVLSSDEFGGRAPASKGEELTVAYLEGEFKKLGLQPGNTDGTYRQGLPLVGITATNAAADSRRRGGDEHVPLAR
jgi:hypothetical protein